MSIAFLNHEEFLQLALNQSQKGSVFFCVLFLTLKHAVSRYSCTLLNDGKRALSGYKYSRVLAG
jgi:hypothetical protein